MGDVGKSWQIEEAKAVIIVTSTTGDGEQPENVIKFWRKLRPKTLAPDHLSHVTYTILGLGDTNYNQFCNAPKALHRRLSELGATTFYPADWADDGTGLEIVVEPWLEGLWPALETLVSDNKQPTMDNLTEETSQVSISGQSPALKLPPCPKPFLQIEYDATERSLEFEQCNLPSSSGACVSGSVVNCSLLTKPDINKHVKDYYQLEVDCGAFDYNVGETVGVLCKNDKLEIETVRTKLEDSSNWTMPCRVALKTDGQAKPKAKIPLHLSSNLTTLEQLFYTTLDVRSIPKKLFLRALLEYTENPNERQFLSLLCSKEGANEYSQKVLETKLSFVDLLEIVPSCRPPASLLLEHLPRLLPRPYSVSSSVKETPGRVSWIFTKVIDPRPGLATSWMSSLSQGDKITFYPRISNNFCPPMDPSQDYIMIAAGSGVGPFIGFLKDRKVRMENGENFSGKCWLVFGCRYSEADFLCKDFIQEMIKTGVLTSLSTSCSREDGPKYVQDRIDTEKEEFLNWLTVRNAMLFVCGDAKGMAVGVRETVRRILKEKMGDEEGDKLLAEMISNKYYKEDIWA